MHRIGDLPHPLSDRLTASLSPASPPHLGSRFDAVYSDGLHGVNVFLTTIVPFLGVALAVLVCENTAHSLHNRAGNKILGWNKLDSVLNPVCFVRRL